MGTVAYRPARLCRSISYRARDSKCLLSPKKLTYLIGWKLFIAVQKLNAAGLKEPTDKYRSFDDLYFPDAKYMKSTQNEDDCQFLCNQDKNCAVFSYFAAKDTCQLGGEGVDSDADFSYYERNHVPGITEEPTKKVLPENAEQEDELEKAKNEVHIVPPEVTELNKQLAKEAARIKQMDQSMRENKLDPRLTVDPAKEGAAKKTIRDEEKEQTARFEAGLQQERNLAKIEIITRGIKHQEYGLIKEGKAKTMDIAKSAFDRGAKKSRTKNSEKFGKDMMKLQDQMRKAGLANGGDENPHIVQKEKRDKHNEKARKNLDKMKAIERQKELDKKHKKRDDVLALSRKVSKLVNDERAAKQAKLRTIELAGKANDQAVSQAMEKVMEERHQKKLSAATRSDQQAKVNAKFNTLQLADKSTQLSSQIQIGKEEQKVKAELKRQKEIRQKQINAASGAKERGKKDEKAAAEGQAMKATIEAARKLDVMKKSGKKKP